MCVNIYTYKLHAKYQWEKLKESEHLYNLGVDNGIILKFSLKQKGLVLQCFALGNEALDSRDGENLSNSLVSVSSQGEPCGSQNPLV